LGPPCEDREDRSRGRKRRAFENTPQSTNEIMAPVPSLHYTPPWPFLSVQAIKSSLAMHQNYRGTDEDSHFGKEVRPTLGKRPASLRISKRNGCVISVVSCCYTVYCQFLNKPLWCWHGKCFLRLEPIRERVLYRTQGGSESAKASAIPKAGPKGKRRPAWDVRCVRLPAGTPPKGTLPPPVRGVYGTPRTGAWGTYPAIWHGCRLLRRGS